MSLIKRNSAWNIPLKISCGYFFKKNVKGNSVIQSGSRFLYYHSFDFNLKI